LYGMIVRMLGLDFHAGSWEELARGLSKEWSDFEW